MDQRTCTVEGCDSEKPYKVTKGLCDKHYRRLRRHGGTENLRPRDRVCSIEGCEQRHHSLGYCRLHLRRFKAHGDPTAVAKAMNYGDGIGYEAVHRRLTKHRGLASLHVCVDCPEPAREWSYDNADENERVSTKGLRFSLDLEHYEPRCKRCHKLFDNRMAKCA